MMKFSAFKELTRLEQTLFALPFVIAGACLTLPYQKISIHWLWIMPAFLCARISGMAFNQFIDSAFDARNPRTKKRAIPSGLVTPKQARIVAWSALLLFFLISFQINFITALLSCLAGCLLLIYSYMKRIHHTCHLVLGGIHCLGPVMASAAIAGRVSASSLFLGLAAACSIIGTDIAYAAQDYEFDRSEGLFSIPAKWGIERGLKVSVFAHFLCLGCLWILGLCEHFPIWYFLVLPINAMLFTLFHLGIHKNKSSLKNVEPIFYLCNISISIVTFFFVGIFSIVD